MFNQYDYPVLQKQQQKNPFADGRVRKQTDDGRLERNLLTGKNWKELRLLPDRKELEETGKEQAMKSCKEMTKRELVDELETYAELLPNRKAYERGLKTDLIALVERCRKGLKS